MTSIDLTLDGWDWRNVRRRPVVCDLGLSGAFDGIPSERGARIRLHLTQEWPGARYAVLLEGDSPLGPARLVVNGRDRIAYRLLCREVRRFPDRWCYCWVEIL